MEERIISAIVTHRNIIPIFKKGISSRFFRGLNKQIFKWLIEYHARHGKIPTKESLYTTYPKFAYIPVRESLDEVAELFISTFKRRFLEESLKKTAELYNGHDPKAFSYFMRRGITLSRITSAQSIARFSDMDNRVAEYMQPISAGPSVKYGIKVLDNLTAGMYPGELIAIAGRMEAGKSTLLKRIELNVLEQDCTILVVSLEEPEELYMRKLDAIYAGVPMDHIKHRKIAKQEMAKLRRAAAFLKSRKSDIHVISGLKDIGPEQVA